MEDRVAWSRWYLGKRLKEGRLGREGVSRGETVVCARQGLWLARVRSWRVRRDIFQRPRRSAGGGRRGSGEGVGDVAKGEEGTHAFVGVLPAVDEGVVAFVGAGSDQCLEEGEML